MVALALLVACTGPAETPAGISPDRAEDADGRTGDGDLHLPEEFQISIYRGGEILGGDEIAFSSLFSGGKPVVLNFWAAFCPPCRAEMPDIQKVHDAYGDRVVVLGLDIGPFVGLGSSDDGRALLQELGVSYPTGTTLESQVVSAYQVRGMPTTVFLTPDGKVHRTWTGFLTESMLVTLTEELLGASAG